MLFFRDMIEAISSTHVCVDGARVYSMGMSNGGFMSQKLACEASDVIAAIAPVAGVISFPCNAPVRSVPYLETHGTADPLVPYNGSPADILLGFESVADSLAYWVDNNDCANTTVVADRPNPQTECVLYTQCALGAAAQLCTVDGGGHTWPDFATRKNWEFVRQWSLPAEYEEREARKR